jgi:hypothetical protein
MAHGDFTGKKKEELAKRFQAEQQIRAKQMSLVTQIVDEVSAEPIDLMPDPEEIKARYGVHQAEDGGVIEVDVIDGDDWDPVEFRARETVEDVTVGVDNNYNLHEGQTYIAPKWVVTHFDSQGLVYH